VTLGSPIPTSSAVRRCTVLRGRQTKREDDEAPKPSPFCPTVCKYSGRRDLNPPFAGHASIAAAHAWLEGGLRPQRGVPSVIHQRGEEIGRPSELRVEASVEQAGGHAILVGEAAVTVLEGSEYDS